MVRRLSIHEQRAIELEALMEPKPIPADTRITVLAWEHAPKGCRLAIKEAIDRGMPFAWTPITNVNEIMQRRQFALPHPS